MGGAAAASAQGAEALFWNPAGIGRLEPESPADLALGYSNLLETTYAGSAAYARPANGGVVGAGLVYFSQSSLTSYNAVGDPNGTFTPVDLAVCFAYARRVNKVLLGGGLKAIRSSISDASAATAAVDLGLQALHVTNVGDGAVDIGAALSNLGPPLRLGSVASALPMTLRAGFLWHTSPTFNSAIDVVLPVDSDPYAVLGVETVLKQASWKGSLRMGYNQGRSRGIKGLTGLTAGAGLDLNRFRIDYAWVPFGDLGAANRIAIALRF